MKRIISDLPNGSKIYNVNYLLKKDIPDQDLDYIFNRPDSIIFSLIWHEFKLNKINITVEDFWDKIHTDDWYNEYIWTDNKIADSFENIVFLVFRNIYYYPEQKSKRKAEFFLINYGFKKNISKDE